MIHTGSALALLLALSWSALALAHGSACAPETVQHPAERTPGLNKFFADPIIGIRG